MVTRQRVALLMAIACTAVLGAAAPAQAGPPGPITRDPEATAVAHADAALAAHRAAVHGTPEDTYQLWRVVLDPSGAAHVRYRREYRGLPVIGGDLVVHLDPAGAFVGASSSLDAPIDVDTVPKVAVRGAAALAIDASSGVGRLAWAVPAADGTAYVDANDGRVGATIPAVSGDSWPGHSLYSGLVFLHVDWINPHLDELRTLVTGGQLETCDSHHATGPCDVFQDTDKDWGDGTPQYNQTAAVDAHYGMMMAGWYFQHFGFEQHAQARVHYGQNWAGAGWNYAGQYMTLGDGADGLHPWVSLDMVGHEYAHGVSRALAGSFPASGEPAGINEATSDIFGTMVEFYANEISTPTLEDPADYLHGEEVFAPNALRYQQQPSLDGVSPDCYSPGIANLADPHLVAGPANHFFYLLAEGTGAGQFGTSPTCNGSDVLGIGRDKAAEIWYHALDAYFVGNESYAQARTHTLLAAKDLYGACSTEWFAVAKAWGGAGVGKGDIPCTDLLLAKGLFYFVCVCAPRPFLCPDPPHDPLRWVVDVPQYGRYDTVEVAVSIAHGRRGDLAIDLVSPQGRTYHLKAPDRADIGVDVHETYDVRLGTGGLTPGAWTLVVTDTVAGVTGGVFGWSIVG
jgi:Zn-dependent metalloprotease